MEAVKPFLKDSDIVLEPCAGTGEFLNGFSRYNFNNKVIAYDIEPKAEGVILGSYFDQQVPKDSVIITNPPYGRNHQLSVQFFNHSADDARLIAFLIPSAWRKWSVENRLDDRFHKVADIDMPNESFYDGDGNNLGGMLNTCFQVWEKRDYKREPYKVKDYGLVESSNKEEANVVLVYAGYGTGKVHREFDREKKNTTFKYLIAKDETVIDALENMDISMFTKNSTYSPTVSFDEIRYSLNKYLGKENT